jgi:hypothetical protein
MPRRRVDADETYLLGINRQASPIERLQAKYQEFQKRMMLATPLETTSLPEQPQPASTTATRRKVLGESTSKLRSSRPAHSTSTIASSHPQEDVFGTVSGQSLRPKPNTRMQVFVDSSDASAEEAPGAGETVATPWNELGTRKERIKENVPKVSKLNGTTLRQPGRQLRVASGSVASTSRISVFRDPAPGEGNLMTPPLVPPAKARDKEREIVPKTPARPSIVPFKDDVTETPTTPRFVPFQDDVVSVGTLRRDEISSQRESQPSTPSTLSGAQVPDSVMKVKTVGITRGQFTSSEAEALRKDPFKNYPAPDKPRQQGDGDDD